MSSHQISFLLLQVSLIRLSCLSSQRQPQRRTAILVAESAKLSSGYRRAENNKEMYPIVQHPSRGVVIPIKVLDVLT